MFDTRNRNVCIRIKVLDKVVRPPTRGGRGVERGCRIPLIVRAMPSDQGLGSVRPQAVVMSFLKMIICHVTITDLPSWEVRRILALSRRGVCPERLGEHKKPSHHPTTPCGSDNLFKRLEKGRGSTIRLSPFELSERVRY